MRGESGQEDGDENAKEDDRRGGWVMQGWGGGVAGYVLYCHVKRHFMCNKPGPRSGPVVLSVRVRQKKSRIFNFFTILDHFFTGIKLFIQRAVLADFTPFTLLQNKGGSSFVSKKLTHLVF